MNKVIKIYIFKNHSYDFVLTHKLAANHPLLIIFYNLSTNLINFKHRKNNTVSPIEYIFAFELSCVIKLSRLL